MIKPEFLFTVFYDIITSFVFTSGETEHEKWFLPEFVQLAFVVRGNILGSHNRYNRHHKPATRQGPVTGTVVFR